jgi:chromosome segregation protein
VYLKSIEMIGFKSFVKKTRLDFERGLSTIVGPNGCGKSNIADAVRWVLGEQSAKALRGAKMQDVIFSGTDNHKPLGMAEVNLTLADCEEALGTEYHEVTVSRRVLRSGEGQYLINRTPCRLKDIQRLFMDTGIGTSSYSLMEQGKIDQILSSRPEDRRAVFEEASGITKYKADKREALHKLDHTEANLLRLDDIIREVRRQIISLQRQAGKARRYTAMRDRLRAYDIFHTRERLGDLDSEIQDLENKLAVFRERQEAAREELVGLESDSADARKRIEERESEIAEAMENAASTRGELDRCRELIRVNQDRIVEIETISQRDTRDAEEAATRMREHQDHLNRATHEMLQAAGKQVEARTELDQSNEALARIQRAAEETGQGLHRLRSDLVEMENSAAKLQNELTEIEARDRTTVIRRERLSAEQAALQRASEVFAERQTRMGSRLDALRADIEDQSATVAGRRQERDLLQQQIETLRQELSGLSSESAARRARIDLVQDRLARAEGFPGGARTLLDPQTAGSINRDTVMGSLAERIRVSESYRTALEAALRAWLDAVVVRDDQAAREFLHTLREAGQGSVRMLTAHTRHPVAPLPPPGHAESLLSRVECDPEIRPLMERLRARTWVVPDMSGVPESIPAEATYVTLDGAVCRGDGSFEWWQSEEQGDNPLALQQKVSAWKRENEGFAAKEGALEQRSHVLKSEIDQATTVIDNAQQVLESTRREQAQCEGEAQVVNGEAEQARERYETVSYELDALNAQDDTSTQRRDEILSSLDELRARQGRSRTTIAEMTEELRRQDQERSALYATVTEHRVRHAECGQEVQHLESQKEHQASRVQELEALIRERQSGLDTYKTRVAGLSQATKEAQANLEPLQSRGDEHQRRLDEIRTSREQLMRSVEEMEDAMRGKRTYLENLLNERSELDVQLAEQRIRRENQIERVGSEYDISIDQVMSEPEPEWEGGGRPDTETLETMIGELQAKLDSMGPVNLVAIEEHRELEERYAFLTQQQDDLVNAKQQLMDMIREINKTTTRMFSNTFDLVNENFQVMFKKLFGGGTAKLVLVDEEDVLESGIEIIARPPGKRLQSVSLLSGGERTMTAVALLFALYLVKPSPFCLLDELDAPLDDANIGRFVQTLKGFLVTSQFIVITHNRNTIAASDILYGVTMQERGVSSIVSVKFSDYEAAGGVPAETTNRQVPTA